MLTEQKKRFADALMSGSNQTESAIIAGYSENSARSLGCRLSNDEDVLAYIERKKAVEASGNVVDLSKHTVDKAGDPLIILKAIMLDETQEPRIRVDAAKALLPYTHQKLGETGKKEQKKNNAIKLSQGRFGSQEPPKTIN